MSISREELKGESSAYGKPNDQSWGFLNFHHEHIKILGPKSYPNFLYKQVNPYQQIPNS